jgi:serine/threonine protein kinase
MTFRATEGAEPFPGYTLVKRLGTGGFGEVWHAIAPGGLAKAIKIIYGGISDARAEQELLALARIREVRHPFLLSLDRFETLDDQVMIVMELAEGSLLDRFEKCREAGLEGIPRDELLGYLRDAADALDYMNDQHDLQHADIKPQNLLLLGGRIKVADFGLVKNLQGTSASVAGGATPIYAAPEVFDGKVSRSSDQYSLAIVYQEMLTGHRPFPGKSALQLAHQHINCAPFLDPLPAGDRTVLSRALSKWPNQRYSNCGAMVSALFQAKDQGESEPAPRVRSLRRKRAVAAPDPSLSDLDVRSSTRRLPTSAWTMTLRPTLCIGIGGLGGAVTRQLRQRLLLRFGEAHRVPIFRALIIDTDRTNLQRLGTSNEPTGLQPHEILHTPLYRPDHYRNQSTELLQWLDRRWLYNIPHSLSTEGMRPLGRLALIDHVAEVLGRVNEAVAAICSAESISQTEKALGCKIRQAAPRVYVVAAIGGGTGAGMVLDLGYLVRQVLETRDLAAEGLCGLLLYVKPEGEQETDLGRINSYATLFELNHYLQPGGRYLGDRGGALRDRSGPCAPFSDTYLAELSRDSGGSTANIGSVVEYLYSNVATAAGDCLDNYRQNTRGGASGNNKGACLRTFGLYRLTIPRLELAEEVGAMLARQLVRSWIEAQGGDRLRPVVDLPLQSWGLDGDAVSERLLKLTKKCLGADPDETIRQAIESGLPKSAGVTASTSQQIFGELDAVFGGGPSGPGYGLSPLEKSISNAATNLGQKTGEVVESWLIERVNDLQGRISIADECVDGLLRHLNAVAHGAEKLQEEAQAAAMESRKRLESPEPFAPTESRWRKLSGWRTDVKLDPVEAFKTYGQNRVKQIMFRAASDLLRPVIIRVRRFKGEIDVFKEKLTTLLATMSATEAEEPVRTDSGCSMMLLPEGRFTIRGAARDLFRRMESALIDRLDRLIEETVMGPLGGLWHVVHANAELATVFGLRLSRISRELSLDALAELDAAQLFQKSCENDAEAAKRLAHFLESSLPALVEAGGIEHLIVAAPSGEAGRALNDLVTRGYPSVPCTSVTMEGDVLLCWEVSQLPLLRAAARLVEEDRDAVDLARKVHTRIDVRWTDTAAE